MSWRQNNSLDNTLTTAARKAGASFRERLLVRLCLMLPRKREELERAITELAVSTGAIQPTGSDIVEGCYAGDWQNFFDWIIANWSKILEMILAIISLFAVVAPLLIVGSLFGPCAGGTCAVSPVRHVERTKIVSVDKQPVRQLVKRQYVRRVIDRVIFWRR